MISYALRRIAAVLILLLVMSGVIFVSTTHLPGDPAVSILGINSTEAQRALVRERLGFDDPIYVQYSRWLGRALSGDMGQSIRTGENVGEMLATRGPITLQLTVFAMLIATLVGVPLGIIAAKTRGSVTDLVVSTAALIALRLKDIE